MQGINSIFNIARGALNAQQMALEVTSHNVANVNTPGYSRQKAVLETEPPLAAGRIKLGMGVRVGTITQAFDQYATRTIHQNTSTLSRHETRASVLSYVETIFNETTDRSLSQAMDEFWRAWQRLAENPGAIPERTSLLTKAEILAGQFNSMSSDLRQIRKNMNVSLGTALGQVNQMTSQIADLNGKIVTMESVGTPANDLRDQRNELLEKLSSQLGTSYLEEKNGSVTLMTSEGVLLVDGVSHWEFRQEGDQIYWNDIAADVSSRLSGGKIGAWLELRDEGVPQYLANLDELAGTFIREVNTRHLAGYTLSGETGKYFFENFRTPPAVPHAGDYQNAATHMGLSADVKAHPEKVAAGGLSGDPGDNENALQILKIQADDTIAIKKWTYADRGKEVASSLQHETPDEYYRALVGGIGILTDEANHGQDFSQTMVDRLKELRDSVSGVNLDEEMTEMMKIQRAHEAAAKLITAANEMLQLILQIR